MPSHGQGSTDGLDIQAVERELSEWRQHHAAPTPLPQSIWENAAHLCRTHGVAPVARRLRLNPTHLRRRMDMHASEPATRLAPTFVELVAAPACVSALDCILEVEAPSGGRLRITLTNASVAAVADIVREFAGGR